MRIILHDFSGHPFQVQLSRELARRGHEVAHWHCSSYQTGKGAVRRHPDDPTTFSVASLTHGSTFARYSPAKRLAQEVRYGMRLGRRIAASNVDLVVFCNTPLLAHLIASMWCRWTRTPMVFWHQDVYSHALAVEAQARLGALGRILGQVAEAVERKIARTSAWVVAIAPAFLPVLRRWGVSERVTLIPNWASLDELPERPRDNAWARAHDLVGRPVVMYTGTLGLKHNPELLVHLARGMLAELPDGRVVIVSEGRGREWLESHVSETDRRSLLLLDFQPYEILPDVMASADVLLAVLEPEASQYSVPSKVLTYLCAGRPVVGVMPIENAAAETIRESGAGIVLDPSDADAVTKNICELLQDDGAREKAAVAARQYAERTFNVVRIADEFEQVFRRSLVTQLPS